MGLFLSGVFLMASKEGRVFSLACEHRLGFMVVVTSDQ